MRRSSYAIIPHRSYRMVFSQMGWLVRLSFLALCSFCSALTRLQRRSMVSQDMRQPLEKRKSTDIFWCVSSTTTVPAFKGHPTSGANHR